MTNDALKTIIKSVFEEMVENKTLEPTKANFKKIEDRSKLNPQLASKIELYKLFYNVSDLSDIPTISDRWNVYNSLFTVDMVEESISLNINPTSEPIVFPDIRATLNEYGLTDIEYVPEAGTVVTPIALDDVMSIINYKIDSSAISMPVQDELRHALNTSISNATPITQANITSADLDIIEDILITKSQQELQQIVMNMIEIVESPKAILILKTALSSLVTPHAWTSDVLTIIRHAIAEENNANLLSIFNA